MLMPVSSRLKELLAEASRPVFHVFPEVRLQFLSQIAGSLSRTGSELTRFPLILSGRPLATREFYRDELAGALHLPNRRGGSSSPSAAAIKIADISLKDRWSVSANFRVPFDSLYCLRRSSICPLRFGSSRIRSVDGCLRREVRGEVFSSDVPFLIYFISCIIRYLPVHLVILNCPERS